MSRLLYSHRAAERMVEQGITRAMVETVLAAPGTTATGDTDDEYDAPADHRTVLNQLIPRNRTVSSRFD